MSHPWKLFGQHLLLAGFLSFAAWGIVSGQEEEFQTPSQKTKDAIGKFNKAPAAFGKALKDLKEAAGAKLKGLGGKASRDAEAQSSDGGGPKKSEAAAAERFSPAGKRDPFRPMTLKTKVGSQPKENLSPLERFELGQLKVVGIVSDMKEPRAMIEDTAGLGYIVKVGTPIGSSEGRVKAIHRNEVVVEESYADFHGTKKKRDVSMKLPTE
jgi:type IV pilus assembly protein PilP